MQKHDLAEWVELYASDMFNWAYHKVGNEEQAKDLVQDTFLAAAEKIESFRGDSNPKTWLISILNFKIIDVYRQKAKMPMSSNSGVSFFNEEGSWLESKKPQSWDTDDTSLLDDPDFQIVLKKCMDALPEKWHACMKLKYLMSKSGKEICQDLDITATNLWQIMHRAKLNLRECINNNWYQIEQSL